LTGYCDLNVEPRDEAEARRMAEKLASVGVRCVAVEASDAEKARTLAGVFEDVGVEAYTRYTVEAKEWSAALNLVRRLVEHYDIIAVKPRTAEAARLAARDPRVALVQLSPGMARYMDRSQVLMLREGGGAIELKLLPILYSADPRSTLRGLMIIARRAAAYGAPLAATSGARSLWEIITPFHARAILVSFGLPENIAKLAVTSYPYSVVRGV
jgi:ribonuclease P/MRP protein subunit RPP1